MKVLVLLFLIGCASAFVPRHYDDEVVDHAVDELLKDLIGDLPLNRLYRADDTKTELEQRLRDAFDTLLEKVKDAIEHGKTVREDVLQKLKDIREKMKDKKIEIGEKAKELFKQIKEKAKDFIGNLLEKLGLKDDKTTRALADVHHVFENEVEDLIRRAVDDKETSEIEKKVREAFEKVLQQVKDAISRGKIVKKEVLQELKELRQKLRDLKIDLSDKAKEIYNIIKEKAKDYIRNLLDRLGFKDEKATRAVVFEVELDDLVRRAEDKEIADRLRDAFNRVLEKVKDAIEKGKTIKEELIEKLKELAKKIKDKEIDVGNRARELYKKIREKARDFLKNLLDKLGKDDESVARSDINIRNIFKRLKDAILSKLDKDALIAKIEALFGKGNELADQLLELLKTKGEQGKQKLLDLVERILGEKETRSARSLQELYDRVRDFFKQLNIEIKERYVKFGEWVKNTVKKGIDTSKTRIENVKAIAKEFIGKAKQLEKDIAVEALEFFRAYKEDLGTLWDHVKVSVKEALKRED